MNWCKKHRSDIVDVVFIFIRTSILGVLSNVSAFPMYIKYIIVLFPTLVSTIIYKENHLKEDNEVKILIWLTVALLSAIITI